MCAGDFCFPAPPAPFVSSLFRRPAACSGTSVVVDGSGFRDFGELMRCRFGTQKMCLLTPEGEFIGATNHYQIGCHSPAANSGQAGGGVGDIAARPPAPAVSPNPNPNLARWSSGEVRDGGAMFLHRQQSSRRSAPARLLASLTVTRSTATASGVWAPDHLVAPPNFRCRFEAVKDPDGRRQVSYLNTTAATVASETELQCRTPEVDFLGAVTVEVTINGLDYSTGGAAVFTYTDHWRARPRARRTAPMGQQRKQTRARRSSDQAQVQTQAGQARLWTHPSPVLTRYVPREGMASTVLAIPSPSSAGSTTIAFEVGRSCV